MRERAEREEGAPFDDLVSEVQRGPNVVERYRRVALADFPVGLAGLQQFQNGGNHDASPFKAGFPVADTGIDGYISLRDIHGAPPPAESIADKGCIGNVTVVTIGHYRSGGAADCLNAL